MDMMSISHRKAPDRATLLGTLASCLLLWLIPATALATGGSAQPVCAAPAPHHASCLALRLSAVPQHSSPVPGALTPAELHAAYQFPTSTAAAATQTIALVDAYNDPNITTDLNKYDLQYHLPTCEESNGGCFEKVNQNGESGPDAVFPPDSGEWSVEIATDVEIAHAICQNCHIVLVEANTDEYTDLEAAEETAAALIRTASPAGTLDGEISNSWGGEEPEAPEADSAAFNHPGIVVTASAGDSGYLNWDEYGERNQAGTGYFEGPDYPAASPNVVAVGGTSLTVASNGEWVAESVWNDGEKGGGGGGGCSKNPGETFTAKPWQQQLPGWSNVGCGTRRAVADVAADADPNTGVSVYDSVPEPEGGPSEAAPKWTQIGGTSVASPIIAATFALAGGAHDVAYPAATLYAHAGTAALHDITVGGNGECDGVYSGTCSGSLGSPLDCGPLYTICHAAVGYDGPTGVGTPDGLSAFEPISGEVGGPGNGSGDGGNGSGGSNSGGNGNTGLAPAGSGSGVATPGTQPAPGATGATPNAASPTRVTHLSLTLAAIAALNRGHPKVSALAFTFALNAAGKVRMTLQRWVRVHGRWRWVTLPGSATMVAKAGSNHGHLTSKGKLSGGHYRLTLTPLPGVASSIAVFIG
jgi:hypothetical protein